MGLSTHRLTPPARVPALGVWYGSVSGKPPRRSSALPPRCSPGRRRPRRRLHPNAFRGEPAISGFAWHFTPTPRSSGPFATGPGSALHERVPPASACPGVAHPVSGRRQATLSSRTAPCRTRLRSGSACPRLSLAGPSHSSAHSTKGTPSPALVPRRVTPAGWLAPTGRGRTVSGTLSLPSPGCFSPFPHGTGSLSVAAGL